MAYLYRRNGSEVWTADIQVKDKKYTRSTRETSRRLANAVAAKIEADIRSGVDRRSRTPTIAEVLDRYWDEHARFASGGKNAEFYAMRRLKAAMQLDRPIDSLSTADVSAYIAKRSTQVSPATVNREVTVLASAWAMARDVWEFHVKHIAWKRIKLRVGDAITHPGPSLEEVKSLINALNRRGAAHISQAVIWSVYTGVRLDGTQNLNWENVNLEEGWADVIWKRKAGQRGERWRRIPLSPQCVRMLKGIPGVRSGPVFKLTNRVAHWNAARDACGLKEVSWHMLRRTHAKLLSKSGANVEVIRRSLGHANISTTLIYTRTTDDEVSSAVQRVPDLVLY